MEGEGQRTRYRRRREDEDVRVQAAGGDARRERGPLRDAEPVLLVDDDEAEPAERHRLLEEGVRSDEETDLPLLERGQEAALGRPVTRAVRRAGVTPVPERSRKTVSACCSARIVVGAMSADW